jgi:sec-independent protein translocase protein TatC
MSDNTLDYYNPDEYRMSLGDHLEELRRRLILSIIGFAVALGVCLVFGKQVLAIFCRPLLLVMQEYEVNPMLFMGNLSDGFMVYLKISMIGALVIASPWIVWQLWLFVAAGLYPHERKTVTRYVPLSLSLLVGGELFVYFLVLPWTIQFFMAFSISIPLPDMGASVVAPTTQATQFVQIPEVAGDPANVPVGGMWIDTTQQRLKMMIAPGKVRVIPFGPENLVSPQILLTEYIDLVLGMLVVFGLSFQLPLVILALCVVGILEPEQLRGMRKVVYFVMAIVAAVITPGDVITASIALTIPLCLLFELGILLGARTPKREIV